MPFVDASHECPLFITLHKSGDLRGCIGTLSPQPLSAMRDYVHSAAFRDRRFEPLQRGELDALNLSVSLLVQYEDCSTCYDWEVGTHGILIHFTVQGKAFSATYLPEVAPEQGWTHQETVASLIRKAGYRGSVTQDVLDGVQTTRYQSSKCTLSYTDFANGRV